MNLVTLAQACDVEDPIYTKGDKHGFWPLDQIDPTKSRFPCCLVWTPLPVVSWLAPFIGHVGLCMEDGAVVDFSGSNLVTIDDFAYGSVARYIQLDREQCCFPSNLSSHTCNHRYKHSEIGTAISWDDAIQSTRRHFEHKSYNLFTCNCHSFAANCLNRICYDGSMSWNMINVVALVLFKGRWVNAMAVVRSFLPFVVMVCFGVSIVGWPFLIGLFSFSAVLMAWYSIGTYCVKNLLEC
ncbi:reversion-to-ethylene sensitivity protein 1 [Tanacetum coccineum]